MATGLPTSLDYIKGIQKPLKFGMDGKFRILHITDIHEVHPDMDDDENHQIPIDKSIETMNVIEKCIEKAKPDLVIFGGDNINGFWQEYTYEYMIDTIKKITEPVTKRNIPLAVVFGNHDSEGEEDRPFLRRENQIAVYAEYENFRGSMNEEDVYGCGNYSLQILSSNSQETAWNIFCMDSGDYIRDEKHRVVKNEGYAFVHDDQIKWYEKKSEALKAQNGGKTVPSLLFQHIPVHQEHDIMKEVEKGTKNAIGGNGKYYILKDEFVNCGEMLEIPCSPKTHCEQFESWEKTGNIVAAFFGHDHCNTFDVTYKDIRLIQTISAGYHTYGGDKRGGRLIVLDENSKTFETESIYVDRVTDTQF